MEALGEDRPPHKNISSEYHRQFVEPIERDENIGSSSFASSSCLLQCNSLAVEQRGRSLKLLSPNISSPGSVEAPPLKHSGPARLFNLLSHYVPQSSGIAGKNEPPVASDPSSDEVGPRGTNTRSAQLGKEGQLTADKPESDEAKRDLCIADETNHVSGAKALDPLDLEQYEKQVALLEEERGLLQQRNSFLEEALQNLHRELSNFESSAQNCKDCPADTAQTLQHGLAKAKGMTSLLQLKLRIASSKHESSEREKQRLQLKVSYLQEKVARLTRQLKDESAAGNAMREAAQMTVHAAQATCLAAEKKSKASARYARALLLRMAASTAAVSRESDSSVQAYDFRK